MHAAVHLMAAVDLRKREIPSLYYAADVDDRPDSGHDRDHDHEDTAPLAPRGSRTTREDASRRVERARSYLASLAGRLQKLGVESSYEASIGDPMTDIVRLARRKRFGLITLSPHSRYAIGRGLGSVTDRVLHTSPIPLLIAPSLGDQPPTTSDLTVETVVVGLDGSRAAEAAFGPARQIFEDCGARVVLLRAIGGRAREEAWAAGAARVGRDIDADFEDSAREYLEDASQRIGVPCVTVLGDRDEVTEILSASQDRPAAMIVMASQGRSGLTKWRLGSITDRVIRETTRPVIVVPQIFTR